MAKKTEVKESDVQVIKRNGSVALTPEVRSSAAELLAQVDRDIGNAQIGKFFALRAGIALIVVKEMCGHGNYELITSELMPNRSARMLRRYVTEAYGFLETKAMMAREVWAALASAGATALTGGDGRLMIGDGKGSKNIPAPVKAMGEWLEEQQADKSKRKNPADAKPGKTSKAQQKKAARDFWHPVASRIQKAGITDRLWEMLDDDELESIQSAIMSVALAMRAELKTRGK